MNVYFYSEEGASDIFIFHLRLTSWDFIRWNRPPKWSLTDIPQRLATNFPSQMKSLRLLFINGCTTFCMQGGSEKKDSSAQKPEKIQKIHGMTLGLHSEKLTGSWNCEATFRHTIPSNQIVRCYTVQLTNRETRPETILLLLHTSPKDIHAENVGATLYFRAAWLIKIKPPKLPPQSLQENICLNLLNKLESSQQAVVDCK